MRNKQKGFSLIELLIVVAIILIIAAIAIPNLIRSKMAANEASAVASIRTVNTAEVVFSTTYSVASVFSALLKDLGDTAGNCATVPPIATNACLIDNVLAQNGIPANYLHNERQPRHAEFLRCAWLLCQRNPGDPRSEPGTSDRGQQPTLS